MFLVSSFFLFKPLRLCISTEFKLDKDLSNMSLLVGKVHHIFLDSLASLVSSLTISRFTIRSKYEHKYRGIWARNIYKVINFHQKMTSYAFS